MQLPWNITKDGNDLLITNARVTCFGGDADPQDNGETSSGLNTKKTPWLAACSLPMKHSLVANLKDSPLPLLPWGTLVRIESIDGLRIPVEKQVTLPVIDLGPALKTGNALDLTVAAARLFKPDATATRFELRNVTFRILGGNAKKW